MWVSSTRVLSAIASDKCPVALALVRPGLPMRNAHDKVHWVGVGFTFLPLSPPHGLSVYTSLTFPLMYISSSFSLTHLSFVSPIAIPLFCLYNFPFLFQSAAPIPF